MPATLRMEADLKRKSIALTLKLPGQFELAPSVLHRLADGLSHDGHGVRGYPVIRGSFDKHQKSAAGRVRLRVILPLDSDWQSTPEIRALLEKKAEAILADLGVTLR